MNAVAPSHLRRDANMSPRLRQDAVMPNVFGNTLPDHHQALHPDAHMHRASMS
jgi:hypothetical protein